MLKAYERNIAYHIIIQKHKCIRHFSLTIFYGLSIEILHCKTIDERHVEVICKMLYVSPLCNICCCSSTQYGGKKFRVCSQQPHTSIGNLQQHSEIDPRRTVASVTMLIDKLRDFLTIDREALFHPYLPLALFDSLSNKWVQCVEY